MSEKRRKSRKWRGVRPDFKVCGNLVVVERECGVIGGLESIFCDCEI